MIIGISEAQEKIINEILNPYFKEFSFLYYGSRVKGGFEATSDLDILIKAKNEPKKNKISFEILERIKGFFIKSSLPFMVNFSDYAGIDEGFYREIKGDLAQVYQNDWTKKDLKDVLVLSYGKSLPKRERVDGAIPVYGSGGLSGFHDKAIVKGPTIIVGRKGSIGTIYYEKSDCYPIDTVFFVKIDDTKNHLKYIYYLLKTMNLSALNSDAAVPGLNRDIAYSQTVEFPEYKTTQQKIAGILSAYDDLIENNNKRIKILEEMAQMLYKEWFVDFKFPNHQNTKFINSELGKIPEGWEIDYLKNLAHLVMGQSPKSEFYNNIGNGLPFHQGVTNFGYRFPTDKVYCSKKTRIANNGDILFSVRAPVGRMNICNKNIIIGRGVAAIKSNNKNQIFLHYQLKNKFAKEDIIGSGSIFNAVTKIDMENILMLKPQDTMIKKYEYVVTPINKKIETLLYITDNLRKTRDLLLPRLISGELSVENLEVKI